MISLDTFNDAQRTAVLHSSGPLLIVAGAGAGKTKTLTHRIAKLIASKTKAESILAITFTNKAAREMLERVGHLLGRRPPSFPGQFHAFPWIGTFHGLGAFILREFAQDAGVSPSFTILDEDDTLSVVRGALKRLGYDPKALEPRRVREVISRAKSDGLDRATYQETHSGNIATVAARVWALYEDHLRESHALDFDDLLLLSVRLLKTHAGVRERLQKRWTHIHVDEYQDVNALQYSLISLLTGHERNICVVGDSDQTIYTWRGASIEYILRFEEDFPDATVVKLEENYRSTQTILDAANQVIAKNVRRVPKHLFTRMGEGEHITLHEALSEAEEATFISERIQVEARSGIPLESMAVLYRTNFQSRAIEEALLARNIPYTIAGTRFFDRKEVKDALAYLRAARNPKNPIDMARAAATPSRGIGEKTLGIILGGSLERLSGKSYASAERFLSTLSAIREAMRTRLVSEAIAFAFSASGHLDMLKERDDVERMGNLSELILLGKRYDTLPPEEGMERFLSDVALATDQDHGDGRKGVRLMTVHAAKGLEFDTVFVAGMEDDLFPQRRMGERERDDQEEERRLFYVALTRAKRKLILTHAAFRTIFGMRQASVPSQFLSDIDDRLLEVEAEGIDRPRERTVFFD